MNQSVIYSSTVLSYNNHVLSLSISIFCFFMLSLQYIYLIHLVTLHVEIIQCLEALNWDVLPIRFCDLV